MNNNNTVMGKEKLLKHIRALDFALLEAGLYLDTHPNNAKVISYFNKLNAERKLAYDEYVENYGPLTMTDSRATTSWDWVKSPWPWEMED